MGNVGKGEDLVVTTGGEVPLGPAEAEGAYRWLEKAFEEGEGGDVDQRKASELEWVGRGRRSTRVDDSQREIVKAWRGSLALATLSERRGDGSPAS